jgi:hypothetical protein
VIRLEVARVRPVSSSENSVKGSNAKHTAQLDSENKTGMLALFCKLLTPNPVSSNGITLQQTRS